MTLDCNIIDHTSLHTSMPVVLNRVTCIHAQANIVEHTLK